MNYRHAYHAGNFADVLKHVVLARVLDYMKRKPAPFRLIDTHAGAGRYALASAEASRTGEWRDGVGRLLGQGAASLPPEVARLLQPYLDAVRAENPGAALSTYPGSPLLALRLLRASDTLIANELHPEERAQLDADIGRDRRAKVMGLDAWIALKALLPPKERRGVVLIDPPFEEPGELERMADGLADGLARFATGVFLAWYPIKDTPPVERFHHRLAALGTDKLLRIELMIRASGDPDRLNGCGLAIVNPPFTLVRELAVILPELARRLAAPGEAPGFRLEPPGSPANPPPEAKRRMRSRR